MYSKGCIIHIYWRSFIGTDSFNIYLLGWSVKAFYFVCRIYKCEVFRIHVPLHLWNISIIVQCSWSYKQAWNDTTIEQKISQLKPYRSWMKAELLFGLINEFKFRIINTNLGVLNFSVDLWRVHNIYFRSKLQSFC